MNRLIEKIVFCGLVTAWRLATWPTSRSPSFVNATTDGVVRPPSELGITTGSPPSITATTEFVVPRSIPITFCAMGNAPSGIERCWDEVYSRRARGVPRFGARMAGEWQASPWPCYPDGLFGFRLTHVPLQGR